MSHDHAPREGLDRPGMTTSLWTATSAPPELTRVADPTADIDVVVVGAGIAGMTAAYHLAREGRRVVVLDDGPVGGGETGQTSAHLSPILRERYKDLESMHGLEGLRAIAAAHMGAVDDIEEISAREGIDCGFERVDGYLVLGEGDDAKLLEEELEALSRAGVDAELVSRCMPGGVDLGPAIRVRRQARFHPLRYVTGLAKAVERYGGAVATDVHVVSVKGDGNAPVEVETRDGRRFVAKDVVVATNSPIHTRVAYHTKQAAYRTYIVGLSVPKGTLPGLVWDTEDPYHYVREAEGATEGEAVLVVGGEDHKTGQDESPEGRWSKLETWARARFPQAGAVAWRWSGQVMESIDAVGFNGKSVSEERVWVITGDSGNGLTNGTLGGRLVADGVAGRDNRWAAAFKPSRIPVREAGEWVKENLNVATQMAHWLKGGDVEGVDDIAPGEGAVISHGLNKLAVYRDPVGQLHTCSAVCPHLKCLVAWNSAEKSWDCPCHGSRFSPEGEVLNGPSAEGLTRVEGVSLPEGDAVPVAPAMAPKLA